jgi:hypothetical protein
LAPEILATVERLESRWRVPFSLRVDQTPYPYHTALATTHLQTGEIILNTRYWSIAENVWSEIAFGETLCFSPGEVLTHEWGHVLTGRISQTMLQVAIKRIALCLETETRDKENWISAARTPQEKRNRYPLSYYAVMRGPLEALAESFVLAERDSTQIYAAIATETFESLRR